MVMQRAAWLTRWQLGEKINEQNWPHYRVLHPIPYFSVYLVWNKTLCFKTNMQEHTSCNSTACLVTCITARCNMEPSNMEHTTLQYLLEMFLLQQCPYKSRYGHHFNAMPDWQLHKSNNLLGWNKNWLDAVKCLGDHLCGQRLCAIAMKFCQVVFTLTWSGHGSSTTTSASVRLLCNCSHRQYMQGCAKKKKKERQTKKCPEV